MSETEACHCPKQFPDWDNKDIDLAGQCVLKLGIPSFFFMPMAIEAYQQKQQRAIDNLELPEQWPGFTLTNTGFIRGSLMRPLENVSSPSRHVTFITAPFNARGLLHHGDIGTIKQSVRKLQSSIFDQGKIPKELYLAYLNCGHCEEERGGHKILLLRRWSASATLASQVKKRKKTKAEGRLSLKL